MRIYYERIEGMHANLRAATISNSKKNALENTVRDKSN